MIKIDLKDAYLGVATPKELKNEVCLPENVL